MDKAKAPLPGSFCSCYLILLSSAGPTPPPQVQRTAAGHHRQEAQHDEDADERGHEKKGRFGVGAKVRHIFFVGHKVHRSHLVAVEVDGGRTQHSTLLDGGRSALRHRELEGHFIVGVAVAAEAAGGVELHGFLRAALGQRDSGEHRLRVADMADMVVE